MKSAFLPALIDPTSSSIPMIWAASMVMARIAASMLTHSSGQSTAPDSPMRFTATQAEFSGNLFSADLPGQVGDPGDLVVHGPRDAQAGGLRRLPVRVQELAKDGIQRVVLLARVALYGQCLEPPAVDVIQCQPCIGAADVAGEYTVS